MKHVTFIHNAAGVPYGTRRLLPDDVAARLEREGAIEPSPPDWPERRPDAPRPKPYNTKASGDPRAHGGKASGVNKSAIESSADLSGGQ